MAQVTSSDHSPDIATTLGLAGTVPAAKKVRRALLRWGSPVILIAGAAALVLLHRTPAAPAYATVEAKRGDLTAGVTETGSLAPLDTVDVGTEVSGVVDSVEVDFNDRVRKGQTLAVINTDQLQDQIREARAALAAAQAAEQQAAVTVTETREQAVRYDSLVKQDYVTKQQAESAEADAGRAVAAEANAAAEIGVAKAALENEETLLTKAVIRAPIAGMVLERDIEPGRTVAASLQTPLLFVLAGDLTHMTLALNVDEADVGQVNAGQAAEFTVDAYPDRTFLATVRSVRNAAMAVEGVVTYQAILDVSNADLALRPGMTATATIQTGTVTNALMIPNTALRFTPPAAPTVAAPANGAVAAPTHQIWTLRGGVPVAIPVTVGLSNGLWTEVMGGGIQPGTAVIVAIADSTSGPPKKDTTAPPRVPRLIPGGR